MCNIDLPNRSSLETLNNNENSSLTGREDCVFGFPERMLGNIDANASVPLKLMLIERWEGSTLDRGRCRPTVQSL